MRKIMDKLNEILNAISYKFVYVGHYIVLLIIKNIYVTGNVHKWSKY